MNEESSVHSFVMSASEEVVELEADVVPKAAIEALARKLGRDRPLPLVMGGGPICTRELRDCCRGWWPLTLAFGAMFLVLVILWILTSVLR
jgi:hypothetical protein